MSDLLVGRAIERAIIDELLGDAERGVAAAVLFAGPRGIGKSALVDYALGVASDFRVVRIVGVESEMTFGYAFALADGITALSAAIADRLLIRRGWVALSGVTGIGAGIVTFLWPSMTALALLVVIATWSLLVAGSWIAFAIKARKQVAGAWSIALGGVLLLLLGVLLVVNPGAGAIGITWAIGWLVFLFGTVGLSLAWAVRREAHELAGQTRITTSHAGHAVS